MRHRLHRWAQRHPWRLFWAYIAVTTLVTAGGWPLSAIIAGDTPRAALPSGHVSLPTGLTVVAFIARMRIRWGYLVWALLLTTSVLTTRQHVLLDAIAGVAWGSVGALLGHRLFRPKSSVG